MAIKTKNTDKAIGEWLENLSVPREETVLDLIRKITRDAFENGADQKSLATATRLRDDLKIGTLQLQSILKTLLADGKIRHLGKGRRHKLLPTEM